MKHIRLRKTKKAQKLRKKQRRNKSTKRKFKGGGIIKIRLWPIRSLYATTEPSEQNVTIEVNTDDTMKTIIEKMREQIPSLRADDIETLEKELVLFYNNKQIFGVGKDWRGQAYPSNEVRLSKQLNTVFADSDKIYDVVWRRTIMA
uniref:Uncharacterized protein n=1 Tax=viral metagenome TaxID=1070528 RepID=A0A6C0AZV8_9ZZZZ